MPNSLGLHAMVWVGDWTERSIRRAVDATADLGYDFLEVPLFDPSAVDPELTRQIVESRGLAATCSLGLPPDADISSPDVNVSRRGEELLAAALDVAVRLGSRYLVGVIYSALMKYETRSSQAGRANGVAALGRIAEKAQAHGVALGLEVVNRYESNLLNTAEEALLLIDDIGSDNVYVHLDTYHMNIEENGFAAPVERCGDRLGYVHIGESHRGYLGTGSVDFGSFFSALQRIGYDGPIAFESFSSAVISPGISDSLSVWRNLWDDGEDLARQARDFMRLKLDRQ